MDVDAFTGEIRLFAGNFAPEGWLMCNGSLQSISTYGALYALIGIIYGGDGATTFAVPDLRGRVPLSNNLNAPAQPLYPLGAKGGSEGVQLVEDNIPAHNHTLSVSIAPATSPAPTPKDTMTIGAGSGTTLKLYTTTGKVITPGTMGNQTIGESGSSSPYFHDNIMPSLVMTYIICTNGIYPQS
ncbi:MAG: tail fiber protein [Nitrospirae bacterium]|nr:tail fiber protein [Magnetococcales bacterium]